MMFGLWFDVISINPFNDDWYSCGKQTKHIKHCSVLTCGYRYASSAFCKPVWSQHMLPAPIVVNQLQCVCTERKGEYIWEMGQGTLWCLYSIVGRVVRERLREAYLFINQRKINLKYHRNSTNIQFLKDQGTVDPLRYYEQLSNSLFMENNNIKIKYLACYPIKTLWFPRLYAL